MKVRTLEINLIASVAFVVALTFALQCDEQIPSCANCVRSHLGTSCAMTYHILDQLGALVTKTTIQCVLSKILIQKSYDQETTLKF